MLANADQVEIVGEAEDSPSVLHQARRLAPDVVLLDIRMPGSSGLQIARHLRDVVPCTKVLILSTYESDDYVVEAIEAGAQGYLLNDSSREDLLRAIRWVHEGHHLLAPTQLERVLDHFQNRVRSQKTYPYN